MTDARFEICLPYILKEEGGNDDDPNDHGGRTSRGVIQREYDKWRTAKGLPTRDVWTASTDEIHDIYFEQYWLPICPQLAPGVDLIYFNIAVNAGVRRAAIIMQRALNIPEDSDEFKSGHEYVGPVTLRYAHKADAAKLINDFDQLVVAFYRGLPQFPRYGNGWLAREARIHAVALKSITQQTTVPTSTPETKPMATTTTAVTPTVQISDPIPQIIAILETAKSYLPMLSGFLPAPWGAVANAAIPIVEEGLQLIEDAKSKSGVDLFQSIGQHIAAIGQHVQSTASTAAKVVVAPVTTAGGVGVSGSAGMPNS